MRIICFGDSWTAGHGVEIDISYKEIPNPPHFIKILREQNSWPRWTAEKLGCVYVNKGVCGDGNKYIYNNVVDSLQNGYIDKDDIIIIMFSWPYRYMRHDSETVIDIYNMLEKELIDKIPFPFYKESIEIIREGNKEKARKYFNKKKVDISENTLKLYWTPTLQQKNICWG